MKMMYGLESEESTPLRQEFAGQVLRSIVGFQTLILFGTNLPKRNAHHIFHL